MANIGPIPIPIIGQSLIYKKTFHEICMYVCTAYFWNKESLMVCNLERKQRELKYLYKYLLR